MTVLAAPGVLVARGVALAGPGGVAILVGIDLAVRPGERLAVIGPNGPGKTSLLRVLSGQTRPDRGQVTYCARPLGSITLGERAQRTAFVAQQEQPDLRLTVVEYVGLGRIPHRAAMSAAVHRDAVHDAMACCGVAGLAPRRLGTLSGGERQRAMIARAVAQNPSLLFLDEPTNHLDLAGRAEVLRLVAGLGITVIAVLHDLALVAPFADRVAILQAGRLVGHGAVAEVMTPAVMRDVFGLAYLRLTDPASGRLHHVFEPGL